MNNQSLFPILAAVQVVFSLIISKISGSVIGNIDNHPLSHISQSSYLGRVNNH